VKKGLNPTVLMLQIDGGPDHLLKRVAVQLALIGMFVELNIDPFIALIGAPGGSTRNKIERPMSVLEIPLAHVTLKRGMMLLWAEEAVFSCSIMKSVQETADKVDTRRSDAQDKVQSLEGKIRDAIMKRLGMYSFLTNPMFCYVMLTCTFDKSVLCVLSGILTPVTDDNYLRANIAPVATVLCSLLDIGITLLSHSSDMSGAMQQKPVCQLYGTAHCR